MVACGHAVSAPWRAVQSTFGTHSVHLPHRS